MERGRGEYSGGDKKVRITPKLYKCKRCGHEQKISTNHYGECYSWGRVNACPKCPPWAKYSEFGGSTSWICIEKGKETAK